MKTVATLIAGLVSLQVNAPVPPAAAQGRSYPYAYYLFVVDASTRGSGVLVPLLLTQDKLEELQKPAARRECFVVWTYERDSVMFLREHVALRASDVKQPERHVRLPGSDAAAESQWYRYQRVSPAEVRQLLTHPEGTIPVHRMGVSREKLQQLLAAVPAEG